MIRTLIVIGVLALGWVLGGPVGIGAVAYTLLIGPSIQLCMRCAVVRLPDNHHPSTASTKPGTAHSAAPTTGKLP